MIKYVNELVRNALNGKKILLRVDFDVPVKDGKIMEDFRIKLHKETIEYLLANGAKVLLVSHINTPDSFDRIAEQIGESLNQTLTLVPLSELASVDGLFKVSSLLLLDNIRQDSRELQNDAGFASEFSEGFDYYVNDAFAVAHRKHASVVAVTKLLPSYAGFLVKKEIENLSKAINKPAEGKVLILGGAKISTKLPVIKNFLNKTDKILIGGALANNFFKFDGMDIGNSMVDDTSMRLLSELNEAGSRRAKIILPQDFFISKDASGQFKEEPYPAKNLPPHRIIVDIGPETSKYFAEIISGANEVIWNGPMGISEVNKFAGGTNAVAQATAKTKYSIIGGGDTIAAVNRFGLLDQMSFVSTGGGAMLEFLAGNKLPGLEALGYY